jgi:hypothetical protein
MSDLKEIRELLEWFGSDVLKIKTRENTPPTRESLLEGASSLRSSQYAAERREQVLRIIGASLEAVDPPSVAEIFEAAYGDSGGRDYWGLWLKFGSDDAAIARLIAAHFTTECRDLAAAGHPYRWSWDTCCGVALGRYPSGQLADRVRSIADDEELSYLISPSLHAFLVSESPVKIKRKPVSEDKLKRFLMTLPKPTLKDNMKAQATKHFFPREFSSREFVNVYKLLPEECKIGQGKKPPK